MKKLLFILLLGLPATALAQPHWHYHRTGLGVVAPDTVQAIAYPHDALQKVGGVWDFSTLKPKGAVIVTSLQREGEMVEVLEEQTAFHFLARPGGNYFSGWENDFKAVSVHEPYNKLPYPFTVGRRDSTAYTAQGRYNNTGRSSFITGVYTTAVLGEGRLLLPGGQALCAALCVKSTERYTETGGGITEVSIEKYLWYVPYYSYPVMVTAQTAYTYNGAPYDTLRSAYYTHCRMPQPEIRTINDTTLCLGQSIALTATGRGSFRWREDRPGSSFQSFSDTLISPQRSISYIFMADDAQCDTHPAYDTLNILVQTIPSIRLKARTIAICPNTSLHLEAQSDAVLQWFEYNSHGALQALSSPVVSPEQASTYIVQADNAVCPAATDTLSVRFIPVDKPDMLIKASGEDVIFDIRDYDARTYAYSLDFGDGSTGENKAMHLHHYADTGAYTVVLSATSLQTGCTASKDYPLSLSTQDDNPLILYPNPADYLLNVIAPSGITFYRIIEVGGSQLYNQTHCSGQEKALQIDVSSLRQGQYLLQLNTLDGAFTQLFIKAQ